MLNSLLSNVDFSCDQYCIDLINYKNTYFISHSAKTVNHHQNNTWPMYIVSRAIINCYLNPFLL